MKPSLDKLRAMALAAPGWAIGMVEGPWHVFLTATPAGPGTRRTAFVLNAYLAESRLARAEDERALRATLVALRVPDGARSLQWREPYEYTWEEEDPWGESPSLLGRAEVAVLVRVLAGPLFATTLPLDNPARQAIVEQVQRDLRELAEPAGDAEARAEPDTVMPTELG